ncbi:hypothetical protein Tco_1472493 [Tanacetum coccineum]
MRVFPLSHVSCHVAPRARHMDVTWQSLTRPDPLVVRRSAAVDRHWPPLTVNVDLWSGGGSDDGAGDSWQATCHHSGGDTWPSNDWYKVSGLGTRLQVQMAARLV